MVIQHLHRTDDPMLDEPVAALLRAASAPAEPGPQPGEGAALAAFRAARPNSRRSSMLSSLTPLRATLAAAVSGGVLLTGGVAAAATGSLPGAAQDTAHALLSKVGVSVPGPDNHAAGHADQRGNGDAGDSPSTDPAGHGSGTDGKGNEVSRLATTTDSTGVDKGAEISTLASDGKSKAGQHGSAGDESGKSSTGKAHKPATTPAEPSKPTEPGASDDGSGHASAGADHRP